MSLGKRGNAVFALVLQFWPSSPIVYIEQVKSGMHVPGPVAELQ
jgi:hypothetical protein